METMIRQLARFVVQSSFGQLTQPVRDSIKIRILDSLGCAWGALRGEPIRLLREQIEDFGGKARCTMLGGAKSAPDLVAFYNGALVRYLDFNDSYLAPGETCHPSDNLGAVLAAAEYAKASGKELMLAPFGQAQDRARAGAKSIKSVFACINLLESRTFVHG